MVPMNGKLLTFALHNRQKEIGSEPEPHHVPVPEPHKKEEEKQPISGWGAGSI
jgi:hypothetical protein